MKRFRATWCIGLIFFASGCAQYSYVGSTESTYICYDSGKCRQVRVAWLFKEPPDIFRVVLPFLDSSYLLLVNADATSEEAVKNVLRETPEKERLTSWGMWRTIDNATVGIAEDKPRWMLSIHPLVVGIGLQKQLLTGLLLGAEGDLTPDHKRVRLGGNVRLVEPGEAAELAELIVIENYERDDKPPVVRHITLPPNANLRSISNCGTWPWPLSSPHAQ